MKALFTIIAALLYSFVWAQSQDSIILKKLSDEILVNGKAYSNLNYICKQIGPRLSGSENAQKAVEATAKMLRDAGADTVYLQPCVVPHWIRGAKETGFIQTVGGKKYQLHLCALGNSVASKKGGVNASVIEVKDLAELDRLGETGIKGKIVFFSFSMNQSNINPGRSYGEAGVYRVKGPSLAAKYGAIGILLRSLATNLDNNPHTGVTRYNDSFPKIPAVAISTMDAEWLSAEMKKGGEVTAFLKTNCEMLPDAPSFNVIGEIRGSTKPEEIISVGGHLDSWDLAEGAHDDGTGVVQSIEIIRAFKATGIKPKRTVRAVLFMNEENGSRGSAAYLAAAKNNNEHHIFALESDGGGFTPRGFNLEMNTEKMDQIMKWKELFKPYGGTQLVAGGSGADVGALKEIGASLAGFSPDGQRYFDIHHAATDVFEAVNKRELHLGTVNMAGLIYLVSEYGL